MPTQRAHATETSSAAVRALQIGQHALFAALYIVACALTYSRDRLPLWAVALTVLLAGWYLAGIVLARASGRHLVGAVWLSVLVLLWAPLAGVASPFRYVVLPLQLLSLHLLRRRSGSLAVLALSAYVIALGLAQQPETPAPDILGPVLSAVVAFLFGHGYGAALAESREKSRLVAELTAARDDLEALQDELVTSQRQSGALAERSRLARDIHDTLAQGFSSILLLSRAAQHSPSPDPAVLVQIEQTASENLDEARRVVHALAPAQLEAAPLASALERLAERAREQTGIAIDVAVEGERRTIPTSIEVGLLRFTQGALANIRQHSGARRARITLAYSSEEVSLDVVDDGVGFAPERIKPTSSGGGFGLRAMRERLAELGGSLDVESAPGEGTALAARIPLEA